MGKRFSCRVCRHYLRLDPVSGKPRCRFRGGLPSGICSAFVRAAGVDGQPERRAVAVDSGQ